MTKEDLKQLNEENKTAAIATLQGEIKKVAKGSSVKWTNDLEEYIEVAFCNQQVFLKNSCSTIYYNFL